MSNFFPRVRYLAQRLTEWIQARPALDARMRSLTEWYHEKLGYRKYGLYADDLIMEEHDVVKEALGRLSEREIADRTFRQRRALQLNMNHETLPKHEWTKPEQDQSYLYRHILDICKERDEKDTYDLLKPSQIQKNKST
jgi:ubiquinol-cytochrome c reductase subunit 7